MKIILLIIFTIYFNFSLSQDLRPIIVDTDFEKYEVIDSAYFEFTYKLTFINDINKPNNQLEDVQVLQVGSKSSKYYSLYLIEHVEYIKDLRQKNPNLQGVPTVKHEECYGGEIFKNYPTSGNLSSTYLGNIIINRYIYEEPIPNFNWSILPENKEILGYQCQKATTTFRGRNYTAWFTLDIPISDGPWKFNGLPGMIMNIYDDKNHYVWTCIGIKGLENKESIKFYNLKFEDTSRETLAKVFHRFHDDFILFLNTTFPNGKTFSKKTGKQIYNSDEKIPYNPIELE